MKRAITTSLAISALALSGLCARPGAARDEPTVEAFSRYAVAAGDSHAAAAGARILKEGGTAADAAAATMLALGVSSPASSGLAGGGFALYYRASDRSVTFLDFRERAPAAAKPNMFGSLAVKDVAPGQSASEKGGLAVATPGEPAGIEELLKRFGSLPRARIVAPAIELAEKGAPVTPYLSKLSGSFVRDLAADVATKPWLDANGQLATGALMKNPRLAKTLRTFAAQGAAPFYRGAIAKELVRRVRQEHGILSERDLKEYRVVERKPLEAMRFGHRFITAPPPSAGGYTLLASLELVERWLGRDHKPSDDKLFHVLAESWKGPFADRARYLGDPDHVQVPLDALQSKDRVAKRAAQFRENKAQPLAAYEQRLEGPTSEVKQPNGGGTSHICVVDAQGNIASVTTTINLPFGARFTAAGMLLNDEMDDFAKAVGEVNAFGLPGGAPNLPGPFKRPVSTMTPTIVFKGADPVLCVGGSGGSRIVTAVEQAAIRALLFNDGALQAVSRPRIHHQGLPINLEVEAIDPKVVESLRKRGHDVSPARFSAKTQLIRIQSGTPRLRAASDPRNGSRAAGE